MACKKNLLVYFDHEHAFATHFFEFERRHLR
jgi:hypothetical protein